MFQHDRPVRWSDVDAAGIVYFPRFLEFCHDALESLFASLEGGYAHLTMRRGIGVPTVHVAVDYRAPLRYGDVCLVRLSVRRLGRSSVQLVYHLVRQRDNAPCAQVDHTVSVCNISDPNRVHPIEIPEDVRQLLETHLVTEPTH